MNLKISVIVAIYKVEAYIKACLDSILSQTYVDFELLLVDDGSPDDCGTICDEYAHLDDRIRVIHQSNQGLSSVRNVGIREASGEYILFVDGDDTIHPDLIQEVANGASKFGSDIVIFSYQAVDVAGRLLYSCPIDLPEQVAFSMREHPELLLTPVSFVNKLIKKDIFQGIHFPSGVWYEDLRLMPRLYANAQHIVYLGKKPLYNYLIRQGSIMRSGALDKLYQDRTMALTELLIYFKENRLFEQYKDELEALTALHGFLYASLEILHVEKNRIKLLDFRNFIMSKFSDFKHNRYIKRLSVKERFQFWLLYHKQYDMIRLLSHLRNLFKQSG